METTAYRQMEISGPATGGPDFRHVRTWIFDLDNTLYCARNGIFAQIEARMTDFVAEVTATDRIEARRIQKDLYRRYGTTLNGLMATRGVDPEPYLAYVRDIDLAALAPDLVLAPALERLPGRRFVFTNGCRRHAERILARLDLAHLFDDIWDIRAIGFLPKPDPAAYDKIVNLAGLAPAAAAMFDDIPHNLLPARRLGMTTVWLKTDTDWSAHTDGTQAKTAENPLAAPAHIDHETAHLAVFLNSIRI
jgi:putative hydrolase of the HAD superfamily